MKSTNTKKFWQEIDSIAITNEHSKRDPPQQMLKPDGSQTSNMDETLQIWSDHFHALFNPPLERLEIEQHSDDTDKYTEEANLNRLITIEEVHSAVMQLEDSKAPGLDKICPSILRDVKIIQYLQNLYQTCFKNGVVPQSWLYSTIQPIFKGSGSRQDPNNYRGITLQSCAAKAFCKILNNRITEFLQGNNILHEEQNGFRTTRSCQDHISSLYLIEIRKLNNLDTYTCFVDFKKAFDSIPRDLLWQKLSKIGIRGKLLTSLKALYTNLYSSVKIKNKLSPPFEVGRGVKQGCTLTPILFNIFTNDLIGRLKKAAEGIKIRDCKVNTLLFADDLVLIAENPTMLQKLLDALKEWCLDNGMSINPNKTKIMHFRYPRKKICQFQFTCGEVTIQIATSI